MNETKKRIPEPWTPVEAKVTDEGISVLVWGREYDFGHDALPRSITACGNTLLAAPVRLTGVENNTPIEWTHRENMLLEQDGRSATIAGVLQSRLIIVNTKIKIHFDGYAEIDIKVSPRGFHVLTGYGVEPDVTPRILTRLWLEVPLNPETAKLEHIQGWDTGTKSTAVKAGSMCFKPVMWFGNEDAGLGLYADSDKHWQPEDRGRAIEIITDKGETVIRWRLLDSQPREWTMRDARTYPNAQVNRRGLREQLGISNKPLYFALAMQATPIKPFYEEYIEQNIVHIDCFSKIYIDYSDFFMGPVSDKDHQLVMDRLKEKGVNILTLHEKWIDIEGYWKASPLRTEQTLKIVEEAHKRGIKVMAYFCSSISTLRPESEDYIERNAHIDGNGNYVISHYRQPPQRTIRVCGNGREVYRDLTDGMQEAMDRFGFDGVYMDSADIPWECTNAKHGCGYEDQFGLRRPTYPISALREEFMEIYERFSAQGKMVHLHSYSAFIPAVHAFCDMYWNGEQLHFSKMYGELTNTPLEFIKTECIGRNIGVPCQFLAYEMGDKWNFEMALSLTAVHGIYPRPNDVNHPLDVMSPVWRVLHEFDVAHSEWLPYWKGGGVPVTAGDSNILISAYIKGSDILAVVANPGDKAAESIRLSVEGAVSVADALTGEAISSDEMLTMSLPRFSMRMILIKKS